MKKPIQTGDLAEVIGGLLGPQSPNIGMVVKVQTFVGEHSQLGRIWRCSAEYAVRGQIGTDKVPSGTADFAQSWLRKIDPPAQNLPAKRVEATT